MGKMSIRVEGVPNVQRAFSRWQVKKISAVRSLIARTANNVKRNARRKVPVLTGRLRKSIQVKYGDKKMVAYVRAVAPHSHLVEYGTSRGARPHPFFVPSIMGQRSKYERALKKILGEA